MIDVLTRAAGDNLLATPPPPSRVPRHAAGGRLSCRQESACVALAAGKTHREAATESGAGLRSVRRWVATVPAFSRRVQELRAEMTSTALGRLTEAMTQAADALKALLTAEAEGIRLAAARSVLELGIKLRELTEIEARIAALEGRQ